MTTIKVLGSGCASCKATVTLIEDMARAAGKSVTVQKVEDFQDIARYAVMSTPAVVIDETVVHAGGVPSREKITGWLSAV
ncbi:MAG: thioredoxin family protein [Gemmatimonadaceae bacterium]|nr:thioredoxin family protein [Gemmatimonadaceae bacterium]